MKEKFAEWTSSLKAMWQNASQKARIIFLVVVVGILAFCLITVILLNRTNDVLLFNSNNMSPQEYATVMAALNEAGIDAKPQSTGSVYVSETDVNNARMQMAMKGYSSAGLSYDTYNAAANSLTSTQSDKDIAYLHQLQDRLQATIESFDEVNQAIVTISMPQSYGNAYNGQTTPATASVMLTRRAGAQLSTEQITGIMNTVKFAVPGLTEDNISITDSETGDLISYMDGSAGGSSKVALTEQMNALLRNNVLSVLQPIYGADKIKVAANVVLGDEHETMETKTYDPIDPANPQNNPIDSVDYYREKSGGQDNLAQGVPGANDNVNVPQYNAGDLNVTDGDYYVASGTYDYLVNSTYRQIVQEGFKIEKRTVAVVVDAGVFKTQEERQEFDEFIKGEIYATVMAATGIEDESAISVQGIRFIREEVTTGGAFTNNPSLNGILIVGGIALVCMAIIAALVFAQVQRRRKLAQLESGAEGAEGYVYGEDGELLLDLMNQEDDFEPITLGETSEQKLKAQIRDLAENDPEIVAQLLKTWLVNG